MRSLAKKLYRSVKNRDPEDRDWFEEALLRTANSGLPLEDLIWEAVCEIVDELQGDSGSGDQPSLSGQPPV